MHGARNSQQKPAEDPQQKDFGEQLKQQLFGLLEDIDGRVTIDAERSDQLGGKIDAAGI
jgi:hypothetical protein